MHRLAASGKGGATGLQSRVVTGSAPGAAPGGRLAPWRHVVHPHACRLQARSCRGFRPLRAVSCDPLRLQFSKPRGIAAVGTWVFTVESTPRIQRWDGGSGSLQVRLAGPGLAWRRWQGCAVWGGQSADAAFGSAPAACDVLALAACSPHRASAAPTPASVMVLAAGLGGVVRGAAR